MRSILKYIILPCAALALFSCAREAPGYSDTMFGGDYTENAVNSAIKNNETITALVTVKQDAGGRTYLDYSDEVKVFCDLPFTRQVRAMCTGRILGKSEVDGYYNGLVMWMEELDEGTFTYDTSVAGADGLDLPDSWITMLSDGYLSLEYSTWWGEHPVKHDFYVVAGTDENDPYCLELRQNSHDDPHDVLSDGIVCFDVNALPDTGGETKTLKLKYKKTDGSVAVREFGFKTRQ